jgi:2',3'-cyclic-nucleotide 2'-phosphodiesterase (5'-nucleotidase family)
MRRLITLAVALCLVTAGAAPALAAPTAGAAAGDAAAVSTGAAGTTVAQTGGNTSTTTTVTVLSYNDIGSSIANPPADDRLGRLITLINERKAAADGPVVVAGGGDHVSPNAFRGANYSEIQGLSSGWDAPVRALNIIGPDAESVQNHEFDYDEDEGVTNFSNFETISAASDFPWLMANVVRNGTTQGVPGTQNYTVVEKQTASGTVRVGFFGVIDEGIDAKVGNVIERNGYVIQDEQAAAQRLTDQLENQEDVDVVVALAPIGSNDATDLANATSGVDVVITGDDEAKFVTQTGGAIVTEAGGNAEAISEVNVTVENGDVTALEGRTIDVSSNRSRNTTWANYIDPIRESYLNVSFGATELAIDSRFGSNYHVETTAGNLITNSLRYYTGADVAVQNAGGIRSGTVYPAGELTRGDVNSILSFGNTITVVRVTGAELKTVLESQVVTLESGAGQQFGAEPSQQVSGVSYEYVAHESVPPEERVRDVKVNGEPIDESETYTLAANSYIAGGGSGYPLPDTPRVATYETTQAEAVAAYLQAKGTVTREDISPVYNGRIRRVDTTAPAQSVTASGSTVTVTLDAPENLTEVQADAWVRSDVPGSRVNATGIASYGGNDTIVLTFPRDEFYATTGGPSDDDVYVAYNDSNYDRIYFDSSIANAELDVDVVGNDLDDDGLAEDVDGDGRVSYRDVVTLFRYVDSSAVRNNPAAYDFNDNGRFDFTDIIQLFEMR